MKLGFCLEEDRKDPEKVVHDSPFQIFKLNQHILQFIYRYRYICITCMWIDRCISESLLSIFFKLRCKLDLMKLIQFLAEDWQLLLSF